MGIVVQKFGGTSVQSTEKLFEICKHITKEYDSGNQVIVVVSAQGKTTDNLIKEAKEINNEHAEIENLKAFISIANENYDRLSKQFDNYHQQVDKRITFFKEKFDKMEQEKNALEIATMQAYRCQFPPEMMDCPVVKILKASQNCQGCTKEQQS